MNTLPVVYLPPSSRILDRYDLQLFMKKAPWEERTSARHEAFWSTMTQPYTYGQGRGVRTYQPSPFPEFMLWLKNCTETLVGHRLDLCFLNRYDDQFQHLGWHADDSPEQDLDGSSIVVQSFGAEREIWFRPNGASGAECIQKQLLEEGSTLIMGPGMQHTWQHRIPKNPAPCGPRVSLTWRKLK